MAPDAAEYRAALRMLTFMEAIAPTLPPGNPLRRSIDETIAYLVARYDFPNGEHQRLATLADAASEIEARGVEAGARPMVSLTPEQWEIMGAGIPVTLDEIRAGSEQATADYLSFAIEDGASIEEIACKFHSLGVMTGALLEAWRR